MKKVLLAAVVIAIVSAACGGSDSREDAVAAASTTTAADTTTTAPATTTTAVATTTTTEAPSLIPSGDPDIDAIAEAYMVAFDSTTDYETKLPFVDDLSGLEDTVVKYMEQGETMGGVTIVMTSVEVSGDEAAVEYDLLFNGNLVYPTLPGTAVRSDAGWQVRRSEFCGMMSSARVGCPAE